MSKGQFEPFSCNQCSLPHQARGPQSCERKQHPKASFSDFQASFLLPLHPCLCSPTQPLPDTPFPVSSFLPIDTPSGDTKCYEVLPSHRAKSHAVAKCHRDIRDILEYAFEFFFVGVNLNDQERKRVRERKIGQTEEVQ